MPEPTVDLLDDFAITAPVRLRIETPEMRPVEAPLSPGDVLVLGAASSADIRIDDTAVSARHCRVTHRGNAVEVADLGSRNGLWLEGSRIAEAVLPLGAAFRVGRTDVRIAPGLADPSRDEAEGSPLRGLVGTATAMRRLAASVRRVASLRLPVLLRGESGTGKDLVARAVHDESPRAGKPFIAINAATISRELAESELFGHQRGAFTGATRDRRGAFREAHQGTLFLDEIGALPIDVQAKLLRVVEEGACRPLGSETSHLVDVRLVVATCEPLEAMVAERRFRPDLYERLAVCILQVPPLRERSSDVPALARHLLAASELGDRILSPSALNLLRHYRWPGNVRELRNVIVQAAVRSGQRIEAEHVAGVLAERSLSGRPRLAPNEALRIFEAVGRNVSAAARRAALPRSTMRDLLRSAGRTSDAAE